MMSTAATGAKFEEVITLKRVITFGAFFMIVSLFMLGVSTAHGATPAGWGTSYKAAMKQAARTGKPLFVVIANSECEACKAYEAELGKPSAIRALNGIVKVRVEASENDSLTEAYGTATPTTVVFTPKTGYNDPIFTQAGTLSAADLVSLGRSVR